MILRLSSPGPAFGSYPVTDGANLEQTSVPAQAISVREVQHPHQVLIAAHRPRPRPGHLEAGRGQARPPVGPEQAVHRRLPGLWLPPRRRAARATAEEACHRGRGRAGPVDRGGRPADPAGLGLLDRGPARGGQRHRGERPARRPDQPGGNRLCVLLGPHHAGGRRGRAAGLPRGR